MSDEPRSGEGICRDGGQVETRKTKNLQLQDYMFFENMYRKIWCFFDRTNALKEELL